MNNRWKMNRIGFVNFWLYDEEEFAFYDGRLLLRGQNGSGKSITTQSFIPFVLDGDRTPSRLDPFGSSDRRMEYYFLGEEGKEEATGYLYLEFQKEHTEEYRTIGIGQRAKRGKPMDFWGFIILDGKRIGRDLWLYKEVGSTKIPYDKRDLKTVLGENNRFTDSQREYKDMVNQNIFGFRREEQYEQFIKLLVKVRAPKLSKEFKPTRVYDILNESLQTLSDEDLRTMVDAMEKMDEIQNSLEMLNRAFADTKIIRNEYTRYNQYMLAKKAQSYLKKKEEAQKARQEYDEKQKEQKDLRERLQQVTIRLGELSDRENLIEAERSSLLDANLEDMDQKLEYARREKEELLEKERKLDVKIGDYQEKIHRKHQELTNIGTMLKHHRDALHFQKEEMDTRQEIIRWSDHDKVVQFIEKEQADGSQAISDGLLLYKQSVNECRQLIRDFEEIARQFDDITEEADRIRNEKIKKEQALFAAEQNFLQGQDHLIMQLYSHAEAAGCWSPQEAVLAGAEDRIRAYKGISDGESIRELLRNDYDYQKSRWLEKKQDISGEMDTCQKNLDLLKEEFVQLQRLEEIEPPRSEGTTLSRQLLKEAGIDGIPFYQAVEFSGELSEEECARLEAQLESMGILDALVVSREDAENICEKCPEFLDTLVYASEEGTSGFSKLVVSGEIPQKLKDSVQRILSNIYDAPGREHGVYLGENGRFIQGILAGRARKAEAEFLGRLTRQRKKEERLQSLEKEIEKKEGEFIQIKEQYSVLEAEIEKLESEYKAIPNFQELTLSLEEQKNCARELEHITAICEKAELCERKYAEKKQGQYQRVLQKCRPLPYGRTLQEYDEALSALEAYRQNWQDCRELLLKLETEQGKQSICRDYLEQDEQILEEAFIDKRTWHLKAKGCDIQIKQYEELLSSPEIAEKVQRLKQLKGELKIIREQEEALKDKQSRTDERLKNLLEAEPQKKERLSELMAEETILRRFFEEELSLKLIMEKGQRTLAECGREAVKLLRESDKNREYGDMLQALIQVFQKHNDSLTNYGASLEECFESLEESPGVSDGFYPLRKRIRFVSSWNGKKVFLDELYHILKTAIDETELLIQQKDRELFEDILSQTISQQLTDRIAESRRWVKDMSQLMKELDTSMGLRFSLDWKPKGSENDAELDTAELEQILLRDRNLLTIEDIEKVAGHFRNKIRMEKLRLEEAGSLINYMELVRDALDYRKWFAFQMHYKRGEENKKPLTNAAFNRFSGGEKAMAMYIPLFAAVNAQYKKAENKEHPRMISLDEAFAGVDDKNISTMFELLHRMDFDYIMNSQSLWGCYETVQGLKIAELHRPMNSQIVSVIRYTWNGHERMLDEQ